MKQNFETLNEMGNKTFEYMKSLGELNLRMADRMMEEQMKAVDSMVKLGVEQINGLKEAKDARAVLEAQTAIMQKAGEQTMTNIRTAVEFGAEARKEYSELLETGVEEMKANAETVAQAAAK